MRITEPYKDTTFDKNYIKDYVYVLLKNNDMIINILKLIYPRVSNLDKLIKDDVDTQFVRYYSTTKDYMTTLSKLYIIKALKDIILQLYISNLYNTAQENMNKN